MIVCINRCWLVLGRILSEYMQKPLSVISARSYQGREKRDLEIGSISVIENIEGKILLVDDIVDSWATLEGVCKNVRMLKNINELKTAILIRKPQSSFTPDYYVLEYPRWIIFPYEIYK